MFGMIADDAIKHDLVNPCRRPEIFEFFYHYGEGRTNCLDNVNGTLGKKISYHPPSKAFHIYKIEPNGKNTVLSLPRNQRQATGLSSVRKATCASTLQLAAFRNSCSSGKCSAINIIVPGSI